MSDIEAVLCPEACAFPPGLFRKSQSHIRLTQLNSERNQIMQRSTMGSCIVQVQVPYSTQIPKQSPIILLQQVGADDQGKLVSEDVAAQTKKTLANLKAILESAGSGLERVLKVNIYMPDQADYASMNEVYKRVS